MTAPAKGSVGRSHGVNRYAHGRAADIPIVGVDTACNTSLRPSTTGGAGFGDEITDAAREYAVKREPIAKRIVVDVAYDITKNWFTVDDSGTNAPDPAVDQAVQAELARLNAHDVLTAAVKYERLYGQSLIVLGLSDASSAERLADEAPEGARLMDMWAYPKPRIQRVDYYADENDPRYNTPEYFTVVRGPGNKPVKVHSSRVILLNLRDGVSVLDPIFDDLTCLRNIRWGMAQTMYRYGSGFPVITVNGATRAQLEALAEDGRIADLMSRTFWLQNDAISLKFEGASGVALNPEPYYLPILENISAGSNIPLAILRGAQAGALTGSEVNEREYQAYISGQQSLLEPAVRRLVDLVLAGIGASDRVRAGGYRIVWGSGIALSATEAAELQRVKEQTQVMRMNYLTVNEVRELAGYGALPDPVGSVVVGAVKAQAQTGAGFDGRLPAPQLARARPYPTAGSDGCPHTRHSGGDQPVGPHRELEDTLRSVVTAVITREIDEDAARYRARQAIQKYFDFEVQAAKDYIYARTKKRVVNLPPMEQKRLDGLKEEYLDEFESILRDAVSGANPDAGKVKKAAAPTSR